MTPDYIRARIERHNRLLHHYILCAAGILTNPYKDIQRRIADEARAIENYGRALLLQASVRAEIERRKPLTHS